MVDKNKHESVDSIAQKSSEELFIKGDEKQDALRKRADDDGLKIDDTQEELSLQNIQRGSEQVEDDHKGIRDDTSGAIKNRAGESRSVEAEKLFHPDDKNEVSEQATESDNFQPVAESESGQQVDSEVVEVSDQDTKRVLFNIDSESRSVGTARSIQGENNDPGVSSDVVSDIVSPSDDAVINDTDVFINTAPVAEETAVEVDEGMASLGGQIMATDIDHGAELEFQVVVGTTIPEGFSLSDDGGWQFDAQHPAYNHLAQGDTIVFTLPVEVTDEYGAKDSTIIKITLNGTNDAPVVNAEVITSVDEGDLMIIGQMTSSDIDDGATASFAVSEGFRAPDGFVLDVDGSYQFDPANSSYDSLNVGDSEVLTIPVTVTDNNGASDTSQIQITISGTNDAPVAGAAIIARADEGATVITGRFTSVDVDGGATTTWNISAGNSAPDGFLLNDDGSYSFDPSHSSYDNLNVGDSQVITIPVMVSDEHGMADSSQIQITIQGTNDVPVAGAEIVTSVDEGTAVISGKLASTDVDDGAAALFSVSEGNSIPNGFDLHANGSYSFDPADNSYDHLNSGDSEVLTIPVTVTDEHGAAGYTQIQITVQGTNDTPTAIVFTGSSVEENSTAGTVVANLSTHDVDDGESFNYTIVNDTSGMFEISGNLVVVKAGAEIDFETADSHDISVQVTDSGGNTYTEQFTLNVQDVNEAPINIQLDNLQIDEIKTDPETVALGEFGNGVVSQDGASGTGYMMFSGENVHDRFSSNPIHSQSADNLVTVKNIDGQWYYDTNTQYVPFTPDPGDRLVAELDFSNDTANLLSGISDPGYQIDGINAGFVDGDFAITVNQWNGRNNAGEFGVSGEHINVAPQVDLNVGTVNADDPESDVLSYALSDDSNGAFQIDSQSGVITIADTSKIDYEQAQSHQITVEVSDGNGGITQQMFDIALNDINEAPDLVNDQTTIDEDGRVSIDVLANDTDPDVGDQLTLDQVEILSGSGQVSIEDGKLVFDPDNQYDALSEGDLATVEVSYTVSDSEGLTSEATASITVTGTNDAPEYHYLSDGQMAMDIGDINNGIVAQDGANGSGYMMFSEENVHDRFSANPIHSQSADNLVTVKNIDGQWYYDTNTQYVPFTPEPGDRLIAELDFSNDSATLLSGISDPGHQIDGIDAGYLSGDISIDVNQWNGSNNAGEFGVSGSIINIPNAVQQTTIDETVSNGAPVATVIASDAEGDSLQFILLDDAGGRFTIDASSGQISINDASKINYEDASKHQLDVQIGDGNGGVIEQQVTINISDVNEAPTDIDMRGGSVDENSVAGTVVASLSTTDEDSGESFSYALTDNSGLFEISGTDIVVKSGADIDFESTWSHDISVQVSDSAGNTFSENFTINVNDIVENIAPTAVDDATDGFVPVNASLVTELSFEDGMPSPLIGAVAAEANGQVGNAADFSSAKVEVSDLSLNSDTGAQTTVSMWVQANPSGGWEMLAASDRYDMVMLNGDIGFNTARGDLFGTDASELADGEWHHIVGVFTNGDVSQNSIHIDGVAQEMSQIRGTPNNNVANIDSSDGSLHFGSWGANNNYRFTGSMDEVKVYDGALSSEEINTLHDIEADNSKWNGGSLSTQEDNVLIINPTELLANDSDPDGDILSISAVQDGDHGSVEIDGEGNIVFTPEGNCNGEATFSYTVSDGNGGKDNATVTLNVSSVNDLPTIDVVNTITVDEDGSRQFTYSTSDIDSSDVTLTGSAENGSVVVNDNGTVSFTPHENYFGDDTITLTATDGHGGVSTQEISVTVNPIEDAPDAVDDGSFEPQSAILTAEFSFDDGVPSATVGAVTAESVGQVGNAADFSSAKVEVSDLSLNSDVGAQTTVSMWVQANPSGGWEMLAASDRYDMVMLNGDIGFNTARGDLFGTDASELSDGEWHHIVGVFTNGDVSQNSIHIDGVAQEMSQIRGTPNNNVANIDSSDGSLHFGSWGANNNYRFSGSMDEVKIYDGVLSNDEINQLHDLESTNQKWDATTLSTDEDAVLVIDPASLLANDIDVDGDAIEITSVQDAQNGSVEIDADGNVVFTPSENYNGEASFTYTVDDGNGNSDSATATLNVVSVEDAPTQITMTGGSIDENSSGGSVVATLGAVDGDVSESFTYAVTEDTSGLFEISGNQVVVKDGADIDYETAQSHEVSVQVTDSTGNQHTETLTLDVNDIVENIAPAAVDDSTISVAEGTVLVSNTFDDNNAWDGNVSNNEMVLTSTDTNASKSFDFGIENAGKTVSISFDAQALGSWDNSGANEDTFNVNGEEITLDRGAASQTFTVEATVDSNGQVDIVFGDNITGSDESVIVDNLSISTVGNNWTSVIETDEDSAIVIDVLSNDSDDDGDDLVITDSGIATDADGNVVGTTEIIEVNGSQQIQFTPGDSLNVMTEGESKEVTFSYSVSDSNGGIEQANVTVNVTGSNDGITAVRDSDNAENMVSENVAVGSYAGVALEATDADGDAITYAIEGDVPFTVDEDGRVVTNDIIDFETTESYTFDVTATSADGSTSTNTFTVNVSDIEESTEIRGTWRSEKLSGTDDNDVIYGEGGNDKINAGDGNDVLVGGTGTDTLRGGAGNDTFIQNEGDGNDRFIGGEGNDTVSRGSGDGDIGIAGNFNASNSIETIDAGGNDVVGDWRSQKLDFSDTNLENVDEIRGEGGNDKITGSSGDDNIAGGAGNDRLSGGEGDDVLSGGAGNDKAVGGEGNDTYVMNPFDGTDQFSGGEGGGWIDVIDISAMVTIDPDNPWTVEVDGTQIEYDLAEGALELNPDTAGVISFGDGSELSFDGVEKIEW